MPGYGLAVVGPDSSQPPVYTGWFMRAGNFGGSGAILQNDGGIYNRVRGYNSSLTSSIILDGRLGIGGYFLESADSSNISLTSPLLKTNNLQVSAVSFDLNSGSITHQPSQRLPYSFQNLQTVKIFGNLVGSLS